MESIHMSLTFFLAAVVCFGAVAGREKIHNGQTASVGEFPYQVELQNGATGILTCGGTILMPDVVLTAAHCVDADERQAGVRVIAGQYRQSNTSAGNSDDGTEQIRGVKEFLFHTRYSGSGGAGYDIAVLILDQEFEFNSFVGNILIPNLNTTMLGQGVASGWGRFDYFGEVAETLQKLDVTLYSDGICAASRRDRFYDSTLLCAGAVGASLCKGDSGSPLTCTSSSISSKKYVCGVASYITNFISCDDSSTRHPTFFSRVAGFHDWILEKIQTYSSKSCPANYFQCENSLCIPKEYRNDGQDDCGDESDESGGCGGIVRLSSNRSKSIEYKTNETFGLNEFCVWTLKLPTATENVTISLKWEHLGNQDAGLVIYQYSGGSMNGEKVRQNITTLRPAIPILYIAFSSDSLGTGPGFEISVLASSFQSLSLTEVTPFSIVSADAGSFSHSLGTSGFPHYLDLNLVSIVVQPNGTKTEAMITSLDTGAGEFVEAYTLFRFNSKAKLEAKVGRYTGSYESNSSIVLPGLTFITPTIYIFSVRDLDNEKAGISLAWRPLLC